MGQLNAQNVEQVFTYQKPTEEQIPKFDAVREACISCAKVLLTHVPECADRTVALRLLRDARMNANAAIALNGLI